MKLKYETLDISGMSYSFNSYEEMNKTMGGHPKNTWKYIIRDLEMQDILKKIKTNNIDKLSEKEIDYFIERHWLEWSCKYNLNPCGQLTLSGKREYIKDNYDDIKLLIKEFPMNFLDKDMNN